MTDRESLLQTIVQNPADDAPRLVFADWLEENGEPDRAEFIRLQIMRETLSFDDPRETELLKRETKILEGRTKKWRSELPILKGIAWGPFQRGFVSSVRAHTAFRFRQHAPRIAVTIPLTAVFFHATSGPRQLNALAKLSALARLSELHLDHKALDHPHIEPLVRSMVLGKLRVLNLGHNRLGDAGAAAVANSDAFNCLTCLNLEENGIGLEGAIALANARHLEHLDRLILEGNPIPAEGAAALRARFQNQVVIPGETKVAV